MNERLPTTEADLKEKYRDLSRLLIGLNYYLKEAGLRSNSILAVSDMSKTISLEYTSGELTLNEAYSKSADLLEKLKSLAIKQGVKAAEITPEKLQSYSKMVNFSNIQEKIEN
jgi:hypothetical protein